MTKPAKTLPPPERGTIEDAIRELSALSEWEKQRGHMNIHYRLNWVLRVVSRLQDLPKAEKS